jgi:hypothetical protein
VRIAYYALMDVLAAKGPEPAIEGFTPDQRLLHRMGAGCGARTPPIRISGGVHRKTSTRLGAGVPTACSRTRMISGRRSDVAWRTPMAPVNECRVW